MSGTVEVHVGDAALVLSVTLPAGSAALDALLPVFHGLADAVADDAAAREAIDGRPVTCRARCAACCHQAIPVAPSEARDLADLVAGMPAGRREIVEARFAKARAAAAPLLAEARAAAGPATGSEAFGLAYLALGIACPFLDDGLCSIYAARPLVCREYLVTSPPIECATPGNGRVAGVPGTSAMSRAFRAVDTVQARRGVMLLGDALAWHAANPAPPPSHAATDLLRAVLSHFGDAE